MATTHQRRSYPIAPGNGFGTPPRMNHENNQAPVVTPATPLIEVRCCGCSGNRKRAYFIEVSRWEGQFGINARESVRRVRSDRMNEDIG